MALLLLPSTPDPAVAAVVRPLVLQFFVLAALWYGTGGMGRIGFILPGRRAPGGASPPPRFAVEPGRILLPFLMVATGLLFFSRPLAPVWEPVLGSIPGLGGGLDPGFALGAVLVLNLGVILFLVAASGGLRGSPILPLLVALPLVVGAVSGTGGALVAVVGAGAGLAWLSLRGPGWPWQAEPNEGAHRPRMEWASLLLVVLAWWMGR
jgi:hypothetical protein